MEEQLLKDFLETAKQDNYDWDVIMPKFPELADVDLQVLKDYAETAEQNGYDYDVINPKFPELFGEEAAGAKEQPAVKKKDSTASPLEDGSSELFKYLKTESGDATRTNDVILPDTEDAILGGESQAKLIPAAETESIIGDKDKKIQEIRKVARKNQDGSESTVLMASAEIDGKQVAFPTLFPKDPNGYSTSPDSWVEMDVMEAYAEALERGEVFYFNTEQEAQNFAEGSWKGPEKKSSNIPEVDRSSKIALKNGDLPEGWGALTQQQYEDLVASGDIPSYSTYEEVRRRKDLVAQVQGEEEIQRRKERAKLFNNTDFVKDLDTLAKEDFSKEEEQVVPKMNERYGKYGLFFEEVGIGDKMKVTAKNGETTTIDLDLGDKNWQTIYHRKLDAFIENNASLPITKEHYSGAERSAEQYFESLDNGLTYESFKGMYDKYHTAIDRLEFIDDAPDLESQLTEEERGLYPEYYIEGKIRDDISQIRSRLKSEIDGLGATMGDKDFVELHNDFDLFMQGIYAEKTAGAIATNDEMKAIQESIITSVQETFNMSIEELAKYTPKTKEEANLRNEYLTSYNEAADSRQMAAGLYEDAKTYFDVKFDKNVVGEWAEDWAAFTNSLKKGWNNGQANQEILYMALGMTDVSDEDSLKEAAEKIVKNLEEGETGKTSRASYNFNKARGFRESWEIFKNDPLELAAAFVGESLSQMMPYGSKIVSASTVAGAGTGAIYGAVGATPVSVAGGAIVGGAQGLRTGIAGTMAAMEYTNAVLDAARNQGYDVMNPQEMEAALKDKAVWDEGRDIGLKRGIAIGVIDYLTSGLAGRVFKVGSVASKTKRVMTQFGERLVFDPLAEGFGEATAQIVSGQGIDTKEIASEMIGGFGNNAPMMAVNIAKDLKGRTKEKIANDLTRIDFVSKEVSSDEDISRWANNMEGLGKISAETNQRIQKNVGLKRDARDILSINQDKPNRMMSKKDRAIQTRTMELLSAKEELSSTLNRRAVFGEKISEINKELKEIATNKKLTETPTDLSGILPEQKSKTDLRAEIAKPIVVDDEVAVDEVTKEETKEVDAEVEATNDAETDALKSIFGDGATGYSFTYDSEESIPNELTDVEPISKSETVVGGKKKIRLTFSGQQLVDAGLGTLRADAKQSSNTETSGATDGATQLSDNLFARGETKNNVVTKMATRAAKSIGKILPKTKIVLHETSDDFNAHAPEGGGYFNFDTNTIHINLEAATNTTVGHEVFHAVLFNKLGEKATLRAVGGMVASVRKGLNKNSKLAKDMDDFAKAYAVDGEAIQNEERLSELFGMLSSEYPSLSRPSKNAIIKFIKSFASKFGIDLGRNFTESDTNVIDLLNTLSQKVKAGEEITESDVKTLEELDNGTNPIGSPTEIRKPSRGKQQKNSFKESHELSLIKPEHSIDINGLIDKIADSKQKVWFWVADQLGIDKELGIDAGPSFAYQKEGDIWASSVSPTRVNKLIDQSDYLFVISGSPTKSHLFNKNVFDLYTSRLGDYKTFKRDALETKPTKPIIKILSEFSSWEELKETPKRKEFLIALNQQSDKGTNFNEYVKSLDGFIDPNSLRDGFYRDNNYIQGDVMLVLKPTGYVEGSNHSTYSNTVLGEVIGVPDVKIDAFDLMPEKMVRESKGLNRPQRQEKIAPRGIGVREIRGRQQKDVISADNSSNYANMTEDGEGNFVFYHVGKKGYKRVRKSTGQNKYTSREEASALSKVGGLAMYYTSETDGESELVGEAKYQIKVPKEKVYDFNTDPLNLIDKARELHKKKYPGKSFGPNEQLAYITKLANKEGFDMVVSEWSGRTRAQTSVPLKPSDISTREGNTVVTDFKNKYESNKDKGFSPVIPKTKNEKLVEVYKKISDAKNKEADYDALYHLRTKYRDMSQEEISDLINNSDISDELKNEYNEAQKSEETSRKSVKQQKNGKAGQRLFNNPNPETSKITEKYKQENGIETEAGDPIRKLDKEKAKKIAEEFDNMKHSPSDPEVVAAYDALSEETMKQYDAIIDAGYVVEVFEGEGEPYSNSAEMIEDVVDNKHIFILASDVAFGDGKMMENPLLKESGKKDIKGRPLVINDLFRAVHDFFGHTERGNGFGALGEENAWDVHARMFTPLARRAMTTETKGQNSWVNFSGVNDAATAKILEARKLDNQGKTKEANALREEGLVEFRFADQKMGLLPNWVSEIKPSGRQQKAVESKPVKVKTEGNHINVGMKVGTTDKDISAEDIEKHLPKDVEIINREIIPEGDNENTLSLELSRALTNSEMSDLMVATKQEAIPQITDGNGYLYAQTQEMLDNWGGAFNPDYFTVSKKAKGRRQKLADAITNGETITTDAEHTLFKGMMPKMKNGKPFSVHNIKSGIFAALDKKVANDYKGDKPLKQFIMPKGTTVEVVKLYTKEGVTAFRRKEEKAIDASDAQVVKLITYDARGKSEQYIIKDRAIVQSANRMSKEQAIANQPMSKRRRAIIERAKAAEQASMDKIFNGRQQRGIAEKVQEARDKGISDSAIKDYLTRVLKYAAKEVTAAMEVMVDLFTELPNSFKNIKGGVDVGTKLYGEVKAFEQKLIKSNERRKVKLTEQEIADKTIEYLEQQPAYKAEAETYTVGSKKKGTQKTLTRTGFSSIQAAMIIEFQKSVKTKPSKNLSQRIKDLRGLLKERKKGARDLQAVKTKVKAVLRKGLPNTTYTKQEVIDIVRKIDEAVIDEKDVTSNIDNIISEVKDIIIKKNNSILMTKINNILKGKFTKRELGRLKGKRISVEAKERIDRIKAMILSEESSAEDINTQNAKLIKQYNKLGNQDVISESDIKRMIDIRAAINLNGAYTSGDNDASRMMGLSTVLESLTDIVEEGRSEFKAELKKAKEAANKDASVAYQEITGEYVDFGSKTSESELGKQKFKRNTDKERARVSNRAKALLGKVDKSLQLIFNSAESLSGLMDLISKLPGELFGGKLQEMVTDRANESTRKRKGRMLLQEKIIKNKLRELHGRKWEKIVRRNNIPKNQGILKDQNDVNSWIPLSQNQMYYLYNQYKDPANHKSFESDAMYGAEAARIMSEIEAKLDPKVKEFADWQVDEYFPTLYEHYNPVYKKLYGANMPWNEFYAGRIYRDGFDIEPLDLLGNNSIHNTVAGASSTKARVNTSLPITAMNGNDALISYITDMEHFAAHAESMRDINRVFDNTYIRSAITTIHGETVYKLIQDSLKKIANRGSDSHLGDKLVNGLNTAFAVGRIAASPVIMLKQLSSFLAFASEIGYTNWAEYAAKNMAELRAVYKEVRDNSVYMQDRHHESILKVIESYSNETAVKLMPQKGVQYYLNVMMFFVKKGDVGAIYMGGLPNYSYHKAQFKKKNPNASEQQSIDYAIRKFEKDTKETQQSQDVQDKDVHQTSNPVVRAMNMFLTTPKQYLRKEIHSIRNIYRKLAAWDKNAGSGTVTENLRTFVTYHFILPMLFQYITMGLPGLLRPTRDDDKDDLLRAAILGNINGLFAIGEIAIGLGDLLTGKPYAMASPKSLGIINMTFRLGELWKRYNRTKDATKKADALRKLRLEALTLTSLPAPTMYRMFENYSKVLEGEGDVGENILRLLNYSEYQISGGGSSKKGKSSNTPPKPPKPPKPPRPPRP